MFIPNVLCTFFDCELIVTFLHAFPGKELESQTKNSHSGIRIYLPKPPNGISDKLVIVGSSKSKDRRKTSQILRFCEE